MVEWRHGWQFERGDAGAVVIRKLDHGADDLPPLPATTPAPYVLCEAVIPGAEFAAILAALGPLPEATNTPGDAPVGTTSGPSDGGL